MRDAQEAKARGGAAWKAGDVDGAIRWFSEVSSRNPHGIVVVIVVVSVIIDIVVVFLLISLSLSLSISLSLLVFLSIWLSLSLLIPTSL